MAKKMYVGRSTQIPIYETRPVEVSKTVKVTPQNNAEFFTTNNGSWNDGEFHLGNCTTTGGRTAILSVKKDMTVSFTVYFNGGYQDDVEYPGYDSECRVKVNGAVIASATSSSINKAWSGTIKAGQTIEVYNHTGSSMCEDVFLRAFSVTHTVKEMQQVQVGSETRDAARRVRRQYVSVDGKARRVRKAYVGVNGKARLFYLANPECVEHGEAPALNYVGTKNISAASTPDYAIFAGGMDPRSSFSEVKSARAYSRSLTMQNISSLSIEKGSGTALSFNGRAVFAGGYRGVFMGYKHDDYVDTYDNSLTKSSLSRLRETKSDLAGAVVGNYMIFAGGVNGPQPASYPLSSADAYNSSFTKTSISSLGAARYDLKAASIGNYAIFAGGYNGGYYSTVDIYDSSLTRTTGTPLSEPKSNMAPGSNESYAIFTGGYGSAGGYFLLADVYDKSLTHTTISRSVNGSGAASVSMGGNIVVSGGYINDSSSGLQDYSTGFYVYDSSLTLTTPYRLSGKRNQHAMAYVGDYALVGGGYNGTSYVSSVEYFKFIQ